MKSSTDVSGADTALSGIVKCLAPGKLSLAAWMWS